MATVSRSSLEQLKNKTPPDWIRALKKDKWIEEDRRGATRGFVKQIVNGDGQRKRVVIHFHSKSQYGAKMIKKLLEDTGWSDKDLRRLKMIK